MRLNSMLETERTMSKRTIGNTILGFILFLPAASNATDIVGNWCENGGPYVCFPSIDSKSPTYVCTDSTSVTKASERSIEFVTQQTVHYYNNGILSGNTKPRTVKKVFDRVSNNPALVFEHVETVKGEEQTRKLILIDDMLQIS